ncbi:hypothetical protein STCU_00166 [Strigomonas culicis]|uniref:PH domain-containing protein n=1 Tax=Strigomonas culicis TaxID=28005 RepID=S9WDF1_9TRYP|nr:hypothetical protein STCU_00166 [Strigomonas culicis]|eukprot:EPY37131.1 hypothetical protein STCU_00166 [Strigomonas culicis]
MVHESTPRVPRLPESIPVHTDPAPLTCPTRGRRTPRRAAPAPPSKAVPPGTATTTAAAGPHHARTSPSPSPTIPVRPIAERTRAGLLLVLVRRSPFTQAFAGHYVVVDEDSGIRCYTSKQSYEQAPQRPVLHVPFWRETRNSRGSRFKRAAVCWPLILPEDCPQATDPTFTYFAVDFVNNEAKHEKLVFAAPTPAERDAWVHFLTKYIDMYLVPRAQSEELQYLTRGAAVPQHKSAVLEGEAPGGTVR